MALLANRVKVATATTGTGTVTLGAASSAAFCTFAEAGITDGQTVSYCIEEGTNFEIGTGVYTSLGTTLSRASVTISKVSGTSGTTKITLGGAGTVRIVARKEDLLSVSETQAVNTVYAGPSSGGSAVPSFRAMVAADLPTTTGLVAINAYSTSATVTIPTGATKAKVTLWGASGGGGGAKATAANTAIGGSGGGAGALIAYITSLVAAKTLTLTIGAAGTAGATTPGDGGDGGNSSLATGPAGNPQTISTLTANGGTGGKLASGAGKTSLGGTGGTATGGDLNITGMFGSSATLGASTASTAPDPTMFVNGQGGATGLGLSFGGRSGTSTSGTGVAGLVGVVGGCIIEWYS
ncbi:MAG: hypothetical protein F2743_08430 [Actinobacteria bacterium]|nr:hypothetical protein [Actinomycetota bacterium]